MCFCFKRAERYYLQGIINKINITQMAKELALTGQSFKSVREFYGMKCKDFNKCIKKIRGQLDKMTVKKNYRTLLPKQVKLIIKHFEGEL